MEVKLGKAISKPARKLIILGSTGSIGRQTLDVVRQYSDRLEVVAIGAYGSDFNQIASQVEEFKPRYVGVVREDVARQLKETFPNLEVIHGREALTELATVDEADTVVSAVVGFAALEPTLTALRSGKRVALANKESMVVAGHLFQEYLPNIVPIDSEHSAIFQCLTGDSDRYLDKIVLTASGGPFLALPEEELKYVKPEHALRHPTWNMGAKITIDSATLMNKALEIIEAKWLFSLPPYKIEVLIHPQSIVHSMVYFTDGSVLAQMGLPDMRLPILYSLSYPQRWEKRVTDLLDLTSLVQLLFLKVPEKFRAIKIAYWVLNKEESYACVMNAANEEAVHAFLRGEIRFTEIIEIVESVLALHKPRKEPSLEELKEIDSWARETARSFIGNVKRSVTF